MSDNTLEDIIEEARAEGYEQAEYDEPNFRQGDALDQAARKSANDAIREKFILPEQATQYIQGYVTGYNDFLKSIEEN